MSWVAAAVAGGTIVGSLISADSSSNAAQSAADAQVNSTGQSIGEQRRQFDITQANNKPFLDTGTAANARLRTLLGIDDGGDPSTSPLLRKFTQADMDADPVYQSGLKFGADQGRDAINARATQAGNYDSGATLKALTRFGTDYGSTKANESYNRFTNDQGNVYNKLAGVSGTGQVATNQVAAAGTAASNNISNSLEGAGNARAAGIVGGANAWGNAISQIGGAGQNYQQNLMLQKILGGGGGGATPTSQFVYNGYDAMGGNAYG
jgi:hypothetical protein